MTIHSSDARAARAEALAFAASPSSHTDADVKLTFDDAPQAKIASVKTAAARAPHEPPHPDAGFVRAFLEAHAELEAYKSGAPLPLTGSTLTLPAVIATARFPTSVSSSLLSSLTAHLSSPHNASHLALSRTLVDAKLAQNKSIYGVSTGFGGSADTRTGEHDALGLALLQHQHAGVVPTGLARKADVNFKRIQAAAASANATATATAASTNTNGHSELEHEQPLPLSPSPLPSTMPPTWVRAALLIRLNSLLRGHSAASPELLRGMGDLLAHNLTPVVPLRGSISASGDLSPLSYVAGALVGERGVFVWAPTAASKIGGEYEKEDAGEGQVLRASDALAAYNLPRVVLRPKEHLAILNGTAFSCALAALCVEESRQLVMLGAVCTALGTEALRGSVDSFCAFIQRVRPHPGQIETGALLTHLLEGSRLATSHLPARAKYGSGLSGLIPRRSRSRADETEEDDSASGASSRGPATPADVLHHHHHHGHGHGHGSAKDVDVARAVAVKIVEAGDNKFGRSEEVDDDNVDDDDDDESELTIEKDAGTLRQDRYPLRTAPQWLGPQLEVVQKAAETIRIECNSTTDNPLIDPSARAVHHGGNFQALAVTSALEPLRLALFHVGKLLFAQATELQNPFMSGGGLAGNLAASDPSLNFFGKGVDIAMAAYVSELAYLANPVSTGVQSAEMHNQAVNSLALVSARYTLQAIETLQLIAASYVYILCQAVDLRALQRRARILVSAIAARALANALGDVVPAFAVVSAEVASDEALLDTLSPEAGNVVDAVWAAFDAAASLDGRPRAEKAGKTAVQGVVEVLLASSSTSTTPTIYANGLGAADALVRLPALQTALSETVFTQYSALAASFLSGSFSPSSSSPSNNDNEFYLPALPLLGRTRTLYTFVRAPRSQGGLGIGMHGRENASLFAGGLGANAGGVGGEAEEVGRTIGVEVGLIYEAIRDGRVGGVMAGMFEGVEGLL